MTIPRGLWIREARPADFREVAAMHYPVWRKSYTGIIPETEFPRLGDPTRWAGLDYPAKLTPDGWAMWLAECAGELVGMSIFGPDTSGADRMELGSLYVAQKYQHRLIGSLLLCVARSFFPAAVVVARCAEQNHQARDFYTRHGFRLDAASDVWKPVVGVTVPLVCYSLDPPASEVRVHCSRTGGVQQSL
jgi:GNAT superfamily N-acetyltransferase